MSQDSTKDLLNNIFAEYETYFSIKQKSKALCEESGKPFTFHDKEVTDLQIQMDELKKHIDQEIIAEISSTEKQKIEKPTLPSDVVIESKLEFILNATHYDSKKDIQLRVPVGQIFVIGASTEPIDSQGNPEIYLSGDLIDIKKAQDVWAVALAEYPGVIRLNVHHKMTGISATNEDQANAYFIIPVRVHDPILLLRRAGKKWMTPEGQKAISSLISEQLEDQITEIMLHDQVHLWTNDSENALNVLVNSIEKLMKEWGMCTNVDSISLVRKFPVNLYKIALEINCVEQLLDQMVKIKPLPEIEKRTGLSEAQLMKLKVIHDRDKIKGVQLYAMIREMGHTGMTTFINWLLEIKKGHISSFLADLYATSQTDDDIALSEQVILYAMKNPVLCVGVSLDFTSEWESYYSTLQAELNLIKWN